MIEFGCGDGNQLQLAEYPRYLGLDVSETAIQLCRAKFADDPTKRFKLTSDYAGEQAELALSLDVLYHLVEDEVFEGYMRALFGSATRHVIIYADNGQGADRPHSPHVRHRVFTDWVAAQLPQWQLARHIPNRYPYQGDHHTGSFADFYIYQLVT